MKKIIAFLTIVVLFLLVALYFMLIEDTTTYAKTDIYTIVPKDAAYIVEIQNPIQKWTDFKDSNVWQFIKANDYMASLNKQITDLQTSIAGKEDILRYFIKGNLVISSHVQDNSYDYLYLLDLQNLPGKLQQIPLLLTTLFSASGFKTAEENYNKLIIYKLLSPATNETLHLTFNNNILVASYNISVLKNAIDGFNKPYFTNNKDFNKLFTEVNADNNDLAHLYINYSKMSNFVKCYTQNNSAPIDAVSKMLTFSGLNFEIEEEGLKLEGTSILDTLHQSYLHALVKVGRGKMKAQNALPHNTSFYMAMNFDNFLDFKHLLEKMQATGINQIQEINPDENPSTDTLTIENDDAQEKGFQKKINKIIENELDKWIANELTIAMVPVSEGNASQAMVAVIPTGDKADEVAEKLGNITGTLSQFNPLNWFRNAEERNKYKGYKIIPLPIGKLLKKYAGNIFEDINKPSIALLDEFLVFSDDVEILKKIIDDFEDSNTLADNQDFQTFFSNFNPQSNAYAYFQTKEIYPFLIEKSKTDKKQSLQKNKLYLLGFPHVGAQLSAINNDTYKTYLYAFFKPITEQNLTLK